MFTRTSKVGGWQLPFVALLTLGLALAGCEGGTEENKVPEITLTSIKVEPGTASVKKGDTQTFKATGTFSDASTKDISDNVAWATGDGAIATVSNDTGAKGKLTGRGVGDTKITASLASVTGEATVSVTAATVTAIAVTPATATIASGTKQAFKATATYSDTTTADVTATATWASSAAATATVSNTGADKGTATGVAAGSAKISAALGDVKGEATLTVSAATLTSLAITPAAASVPVALKQAFKLTGTFSDNSTQDLTAQATWTSSAVAVATVSDTGATKGEATGVSAGAATITATQGGKTATATLAVTAATLRSIAVTPATASIAKGSKQTFTATGTYSDNTTQDLSSAVTWSSSDATKATVSNTAGTKGEATAVAVGSATITATLGTTTGTATLTITAATLSSIAITPGATSVAVGTKTTFVATGTFSDNSTQVLTDTVTWASSDAAKATISNAAGTKGEATGVAAGQTSITATLSGKTGTAALTVTTATLVAINVSPTNPSVAVGTTVDLVATGVFSDASTQDITALVTWTSATPATATVSNAAGSHGTVTGVAAGTVAVSAARDGKTGSTNVTVTAAAVASIAVAPGTASSAVGTTQAFTATATLTDNSTQDVTSLATWSSSDDTKATVSNATGSKGTATAVAVGTSTISAAFSGKTGSATYVIRQATLSSIEVAPATRTAAAGSSVQYTATGRFSDGSNQDITSTVTWSSSDESKATISNASGSKGLASALVIGSATITATQGAISGTGTLTISDATLTSISVTPAGSSLAAGTTLQYAATGRYSDGSTQTITTAVTWTTDNASVATISPTAGLLSAVSRGGATVTATLTGVSGSTTVTVTDALLRSVTVSPGNATTPAGRTVAFTASAAYSDGSVQDVTSLATWTSSNESFATVSNSDGSRGVATGVASGAVTVSAAFGGQTGSGNLAVSDAVMTGLTISPLAQSRALGVRVAYTARAQFSNATSQDVTTQVSWSSSDTATITISNAADSNGFADSLRTGSATISATLGAFSASTTQTVTGATLYAVSVTPASIQIAKFTKQQFTATGIFTDNTTQNLTSAVTWSTSDAALASVSNANGTQGLATASAPGTVVVSALFQGVTGTATLNISDVDLTEIVVDCTPTSVPKGTGGRCTATGLFSDETSQDLTNQVSWSTEQGAVVISNATGSHGAFVGERVTTCNQEGFARIACVDFVYASLLGQQNSGFPVEVRDAALVELSIQSESVSAAQGRSVQYRAFGRFTDGTVSEVTNSVEWSSASDTVASVGNEFGEGSDKGLVTAISVGSTTITASSNEGSITATRGFTTTTAVLTGIEIAPTNTSVAAGQSQAFTATGLYSNNTRSNITGDVTWSVGPNGGSDGGDPTAVSISNANDATKGLATTTAPAAVTITATLGNVTNSVPFRVTDAALTGISITPVNPSIANGRTQQFEATGSYTDNVPRSLTNPSTWSVQTLTATTQTSDGGMPPVASTSQQGFVTAQSPGTARVTASFGGFSGSTVLTVTDAVVERIEVSPPSLSLPRGRSSRLSATGFYSDGTTGDLTNVVAWSSASAAFASVLNGDGAGTVTGNEVTSSPVVITAFFSLGITSSSQVTVTPAVLTGIEVSPRNGSKPKGLTQQFTATGNYSDGTSQDLTNQVIWSSSSGGETVAVSNTSGQEGSANLNNAGNDSITATYGCQQQGGSSSSSGTTGGIPTPPAPGECFYDSVGYTVSAAQPTGLRITPLNDTIPLGTNRLFQAYVSFTDNSEQDVSTSTQLQWSSSSGAVASISNASASRGRATSISVGTTTITASFGSTNPLTAATSLTISNARLTSIALTPANPTRALGFNVPFRAVGTFTDQSTQDITADVTFTTSDSRVAFVDNTVGAKGLATSNAVGTATITASQGTIVGSTVFTVTDATVVSIAITPVGATFNSCQSLQYTAVATLSDGTTQDVTAQAQWSSSNTGVLFISNASGQQGRAFPGNDGSANVTATLNGVQGTTNAQVATGSNCAT